MRAMELMRVMAVHAAETIRRVLWEVPLRSSDWMPCGSGQFLSLAILGDTADKKRGGFSGVRSVFERVCLYGSVSTLMQGW